MFRFENNWILFMTSAASSPFKLPLGVFNTESFANFLPNTDSAAVMARRAMEASSASTRVSVKGMQDAGQALMSHFKDQMALSVETGKKLSEAGTLADAMTIQTGFVKSALENNMKGFGELSSLYTEVLRESFAALAKQAEDVAETAKPQ